MRIRRTKGALDGFLLILLGLWGALIPFVGPYFDYAVGRNATWHYTSDRLWLSILPGAAVALGGLILLLSRNRLTAVFGGWLALAGGVWFVVGQQVSTLWNHGQSISGPLYGGTTRRFLEQMGYFDGLGVLIVALAAFALGRLAVRSVRDAAYLDELAGTAPAATTTRSGRFGRRGRFTRDRTDDRTVVDRDPGRDRDGDGVDDRDEAATKPGLLDRLRR
jgi:hypothetical protein